MPIAFDGKTYYRTMEVCRIVGISRNTLFRWIKKGMVGEKEYRDWRGWRLFTQSQLDEIVARTREITVQGEKN
jgi:predicted site-specific integrase-resolvase